MAQSTLVSDNDHIAQGRAQQCIIYRYIPSTNGEPEIIDYQCKCRMLCFFSFYCHHVHHVIAHHTNRTCARPILQIYL